MDQKLNMNSKSKDKKFPIWPLILILALWVVAVIIAPEEKSLKAGIKPVYVHVALTWMGMLSLSISAILGLYGAFTKNKNLYRWIYIVFGVSVGIYILGYFSSMISSYINWGGVPFQEPRFISTLNVIIASILTGGIMLLVPWDIVKSALTAFPVLFIFLTIQTDRMVLHPDSAVESAPLGIRLSFYGMFVIALLFYVWWVFYIERLTRK
jgi:hypothetical protein